MFPEAELGHEGHLVDVAVIGESFVLVHARLDDHEGAGGALALEVLHLDGVFAIVCQILHAHSNRTMPREHRRRHSRITQSHRCARLAALIIRADADIILRALLEISEGVAGGVVPPLEALGLAGTAGRRIREFVRGAAGTGALVEADFCGVEAFGVDLGGGEGRGPLEPREVVREVAHVVAVGGVAAVGPAYCVHGGDASFDSEADIEIHASLRELGFADGAAHLSTESGRRAKLHHVRPFASTSQDLKFIFSNRRTTIIRRLAPSKCHNRCNNIRPSPFTRLHGDTDASRLGHVRPYHD